MVRHDIKKSEYVWEKKRRRSADRGKSTDRRRKIVDGIILQDYERRNDENQSFDGEERRNGKDRRSGKDRRK